MIRGRREVHGIRAISSSPSASCSALATSPARGSYIAVVGSSKREGIEVTVNCAPLEGDHIISVRSDRLEMKPRHSRSLGSSEGDHGAVSGATRSYTS